MATLNIVLQYTTGASVSVELEQSVIAEVSVFVYHETYFMFGRMKADNTLVFNEINLPYLLA